MIEFSLCGKKKKRMKKKQGAVGKVFFFTIFDWVGGGREGGENIYQ